MVFGWWFIPWELWSSQLVDIHVFALGLQSPLPSPVLSLTLPLGFPSSVLCMNVSICICIIQVRVEPLMGQPYHEPVSKCVLTSAIVLVFGVCR